MTTINVFIPAAGVGERLLPITNHIPKPLMPILGKPVLELILERIIRLPINKIGINLHHKKEIVEKWVRQSPFSRMIEFFPEDPILGTGGAFKNAEGFLKNSIFLVHNSDILSDIDLEKLIEIHLSAGNLATLAVHDYPEFNKLEIDENGYLIDLQHNILKQVHDDTCVDRLSSCRTCLGTYSESLSTKKLKAFTGIAIYSPEFLKFLPSGISSVVDTWLNTVSAGYKIGTIDVSGCYWRDIGTPVSYAKAVIEELRRNGESVYIHPSVNWCKDIKLDGYVVIENESNPTSPPFSKGGLGGFSGVNVPHKATSLRNCIILPGTTSPSPPFNFPLTKGGRRGDKGETEGVVENCILGPGFQIPLNESEILNSAKKTDATLIGTGGSDRKYYRIKKDRKTLVFMKCNPGDKDFQRHIEYTRFFKKYSVPVPDLIETDSQNMSALFEDLGDLSLYSWLKCEREPEQIEDIYQKVIDILILIHAAATEHVSECPLLHERIFDYEYLRWETGYFIERFVEGIRNIKIKNLSALNDEFHRLAIRVDSFPKTIIHRDFQSQNIMITKGGIPRILDYQGARIGPPAYDVVSILWDPYYCLEDNMRAQLLEYYIGKMTKLYNHNKEHKTNPPTPPLVKGGEGGFFNKIEVEETLLHCRLQRHMQALGAYGFLSTVKGKKYFMKYIPEALRLLKEDISISKDEYPELYRLIMKL
ncbi:MAG: phosphotransferase [Nitrospirota bacterium]